MKITAVHALATVKARAQAQTNCQFPGHRAMLAAATSLGDDEMDTYRALRRLGHYQAAEGAWARRTAARELGTILVACL